MIIEIIEDVMTIEIIELISISDCHLACKGLRWWNQIEKNECGYFFIQACIHQIN